MRKFIVLLVAVLMLAATVPVMAASFTPAVNLSISEKLDLEATQAPAAIDPNICGGKIAVYLYDRVNFDTGGPVLKICGNSTNNIVVPDLSVWGSGALDNKASSLRTRNMVYGGTSRFIRVYTGYSYTGSTTQFLGNKDIDHLQDYFMSDVISSLKAS